MQQFFSIHCVNSFKKVNKNILDLKKEYALFILAQILTAPVG